MRRISNLIAMCLLVALLASCSNRETGSKAASATPPKIEKVVGIARIEPEKGLLYIYSNTNGQIESINANVGELVKEGTVFASLKNSTDIAQLNLEKSKTHAQQAAIQVAETNADILLADWQKAKGDMALNEQLFAAKAITGQMLNDSKVNATRLGIEYKKALAEAEQTRSKTTEINAGIHNQQAIINSKQITAAFDGRVLQWDAHKGDYITEGQKLGLFAPNGALIARTEIDELFADKIKTGMKAEIISQLNGEKIGEGEVVFVAGFLKKKSLFTDEDTAEDRRVKEVHVRLNPQSQITINNRVDCVIFFNK